MSVVDPVVSPGSGDSLNVTLRRVSARDELLREALPYIEWRKTVVDIFFKNVDDGIRHDKTKSP